MLAVGVLAYGCYSTRPCDVTGSKLTFKGKQMAFLGALGGWGWGVKSGLWVSSTLVVPPSSESVSGVSENHMKT